MLSFRFSPTKDDYVKSFRTFYLSNWPTWAVIMFFLFTQMICIGSAFIRADLGFEFGGILPIVLLIFPVIYLAFIFILNPLTVASKVQKDERLNSPIQYEVNEEQIVFRNQFSETKLDWGSFQKVIESKDLFLLVYAANKNMFQLIPKRAFSSIDDEKAFRNLLDAKIPKKRKNRFDIKNPATIITIVLMTGFCLLICATVAISFYTASMSK